MRKQKLYAYKMIDVLQPGKAWHSSSARWVEPKLATVYVFSGTMKHVWIKAGEVFFQIGYYPQE